MAYEVTATRRRPQHFEDLIGQEFVVATLKNAIKTGKIAHAYLFSGPRGCGKTSSARILAKALNCEKGPTDEPCCTCTACKEITQGTSLDVIEIDGASNTSVNDIRQIKDEVLFPPNSLRYKIYIIDEVHMLSTSAFNALLKTIEEPPQYVIFIFATTELHKVPATIKSRCQHFNFRLVAPEQIKKLLKDASDETGIKADDEALYWIARESTGSIRDAYTLYDQVAAFSEDHITYDKIRDKLGLTGVDSLNTLCEACASGDSEKALTILDEILQRGVSVEQFITNITDYLRSLLFISCSITRESILGQSVSRFSPIVLQNWSKIQLERGISLFLQLYRDIRYSLSPRFELELAVSRLTWLSSYVSPADVSNAISQVRMQLSKPAFFSNEIQNQKKTAEHEQIVHTQQNFNSQTNQQQYQQPATRPNDNPFEQMKRNLNTISPLQNEAPSPKEMPATYADSMPLEKPNFSTSKSELHVIPAEKTAINNDSHSSRDNTIPPKNEQQQEPMHTAAPGSVIAENQQKDSVQAEKTEQNLKASINPLDILSEALQKVSEEKAMIGAAISHVSKWTATETSIMAEVDSPFLKNQLEGESNYISSIFSEMCGGQIKFSAKIAEVEAAQPENTTTPPEVEILCRVFKGTEV